MKVSWLHWKSGSWNPLIDRTCSVVALRTFVLGFVSKNSCQKEELPKKVTHRDLGDCYQYFLWC